MSRVRYVVLLTNTRPIDNGASEIRPKTLLPGAFGTKIRTTVGNTAPSKTRVPEHEAPSYAWGSTAITVAIDIQGAEGGTALAITEHLAEALQYLRY